MEPNLYVVIAEGDSPGFFATLEEAEVEAEKIMTFHREIADRDGNWSDYSAVRIYRLVSESVVTDGAGEEGFSDYVTTDAPATDPE